MEPLAARAQLRILRIFGSGTPPAFPLRPLDPDGLQEARDACELLKDCFYTIQFIQTMLIKNNSQAANIAFAMQAFGHQGRVEHGLMPKPVLVKPL